jgi:hypothetical protein
MAVRHTLLLAAAVWHWPALARAADDAQSPAARGGACAEGAAEPSGYTVLRPTKTAHCPYDLTELRGRILKLIAVKEGALRLATIERLFGLPKLETSFDDPRAAWYNVSLTGGRGPGSWKARLDFRESFYPLVDLRPPRFRAGRRPVPLKKGERGDIYFSISMSPLDDVSESAGCWPAEQLLGAAAKLGWKDETDLGMPPSHGGPRSLVLRRGMLTLFPNLDEDDDRTSGCVREVRLDQEADPPSIPLTPAEEEILQRRSAAEIASDRERRWLALPAVDEEDSRARNAQAKFMRDALHDFVAREQHEAAEEAIAAMSTEELRQFALQAALGYPWWDTREICEAAIKEEDPPAALLRIAKEKGLDQARTALARTYCLIHVQGRRYRHLTLPAPK